MKVILLEELRGKGGEGDVIDVAQGYAENYLIPKGIAIMATPGNLKQLEERRHNIEKRELARTTDAETLKNALDGKAVVIKAKVGDEGQLFGSVTAANIAEAIAEQIGAEVDRRRIEISKPIKRAGNHEVVISLYREIAATLTVSVVDAEASEEEKEEPVKSAVEPGEQEDASQEVEAAADEKAHDEEEKPAEEDVE